MSGVAVVPARMKFRTETKQLTIDTLCATYLDICMQSYWKIRKESSNILEERWFSFDLEPGSIHPQPFSNMDDSHSPNIVQVCLQFVQPLAFVSVESLIKMMVRGLESRQSAFLVFWLRNISRETEVGCCVCHLDQLPWVEVLPSRCIILPGSEWLIGNYPPWVAHFQAPSQPFHTCMQ